MGDGAAAATATEAVAGASLTVLANAIPRNKDKSCLGLRACHIHAIEGGRTTADGFAPWCGDGVLHLFTTKTSHEGGKNAFDTQRSGAPTNFHTHTHLHTFVCKSISIHTKKHAHISVTSTDRACVVVHQSNRGFSSAMDYSWHGL